jgi:hypothetical protein
MPRRDDRDLPRAELEDYPLLASLVNDLREAVPVAQLQQLDLTDKTLLVKEVQNLVSASPESGLRHMHCLFTLLEEENLLMVEIALTAIAECFFNCCPLYRIQGERSKAGPRLSKDEFARQEFEQGLIALYKKYIDLLDLFLKNRECPPKLKKVSARCLCSLHLKLSHFNLSERVSRLVVHYSFSASQPIRSITADALTEVLSNRKLAAVTAKH